MSATLTPQLAERGFRALGSDVRLLGGSPRALAQAERWILAAQARLSRFEAASELAALNADPTERVAASPPLRRAVSAALWAARATGGLVDPTLLDALQRAGYDRSIEAIDRCSLMAALALAPARRPARPHPAARWRQVRVDDRAAVIDRPPGTRLDLGGSGKGWIVDRVIERYGIGVVDCGGDLRVTRPTTVLVEHPLSGCHVAELAVDRQAVATSGLDRRVWLTASGPAHHLLDPASGRPAWTGLAGVTALAPTALQAETRAKAALLSGPRGARRWLARYGGVLLHEDGDAERVHPA